MRFHLPLIFIFLCVFFKQYAQSSRCTDTLFYMNGKIEQVCIIDTVENAVGILDEKDTSKRLEVDADDLFAVRFTKEGKLHYYYRQDSANGNYFSRDEMKFFLIGERDARKGFRSPGSLFGSFVVGYAAGLTGSILSPIAPFGFMALSGLPRVRIKHDTVSNPYYLDSDPYILGYERQARTKRRMDSLKGGLTGLITGLITHVLYVKFVDNKK